MTRHHSIWDAGLGRQINIEFTAEEETARDLEVLTNKAETIAAKELSDQKEVAKQSGLAKLYAQAGLTAEEIAAQR